MRAVRENDWCGEFVYEFMGQSEALLEDARRRGNQLPIPDVVPYASDYTISTFRTDL
jgi:hypothetical protein